jgi:hypothetical protein
LIALEQNINFAEKNKIEVNWKFPLLLVELISRRPSVYAEAIDLFLDLRSLAVRIVYDEFIRYSKGQEDLNDIDPESVIEIKLDQNSFTEGCTVKLPLPLIRSTSVLLSIWKDEYRKDEQNSSSCVDKLVSSLMRTNYAESGDDNGNDVGLVSAKSLSKQGDVVSVELVSETAWREVSGLSSYSPLTLRSTTVDNACEGTK